MRLRPSLLSILALCGLAAAPPARAASGSDYIALGDSYAYGFTTINNLAQSYLGYQAAVASHQPDPTDQASLLGLQGYVAPFAGFLATQNGGVAPNVFNFALPGETLSSFSQAHDPSQLNPNPAFLAADYASDSAISNLNYAASGFSASQQGLLTSVLAQEQGAGHTVRDITVQLGGNDLLDAVRQGQTPNFGVFDANYTSLLKTLKQDAPSASIFVIGYFDPFTPLDTNNPSLTNPDPSQRVMDPFSGAGAILLPVLNSNLQADAAAAGVTFVNIAPAFAGREEALSYDTLPLNGSFGPADGVPNYHPTPAGYQVIAGQIQMAAVPEPGAWALLALGLPLVGLAIRRRTRL